MSNKWWWYDGEDDIILGADFQTNSGNGSPKVSERYEKCLQASSSVKGESLCIGS